MGEFEAFLFPTSLPFVMRAAAAGLGIDHLASDDRSDTLTCIPNNKRIATRLRKHDTPRDRIFREGRDSEQERNMKHS